MKLKILDAKKEIVGEKELPAQFNEEIRPDLVRKSVLVIRSNSRQPYGTDPMAGMRASSKVSRRRRDYKASYGKGISRVPRKIMSRRGARINWVGAFAPGTVKGRRAHPPKASKIWDKKMNKKERRKAIRSALSATVKKDIVQNRGHIIPENYPFVLSAKFEELGRTKDVISALENLGLKAELERVAKRNVRAGKGKMRGRKYKKIRGFLIVVSKKCRLCDSATNLPGVEVTEVNRLNAEVLAPGLNIGRLTLFTEDAIERMKKEKLFM